MPSPGFAALVPEMPRPGEDHRQAVLVAGGDHLGVAARAAGLDDGRDAGRGGAVDRIVEREEGVGGQHRAARPGRPPS